MNVQQVVDVVQRETMSHGIVFQVTNDPTVMGMYWITLNLDKHTVKFRCNASSLNRKLKTRTVRLLRLCERSSV